MFIKARVLNMVMGKKFILASNSSSRYELLKNAGLRFSKTQPLCNEENIKRLFIKSKKNKKNLPSHLAREKALSVSKNNPNSLIVGSDTVIIFKNEIINKAKNLKEAKTKLKKLP